MHDGHGTPAVKTSEHAVNSRDGLSANFDDCRRMIGYETGRLKMFSDGLFVWKSKKSGLFVGRFGDGGTGVADGGFGCRCFHAAFLAYFGNHFIHFVHGNVPVAAGKTHHVFAANDDGGCSLYIHFDGQVGHLFGLCLVAERIIGGNQFCTVERSLRSRPFFEGGTVGQVDFFFVEGAEYRQIGLIFHVAAVYGSRHARQADHFGLPNNVQRAQIGVGSPFLAVFLHDGFEVVAVDTEIAEKFGYFDFAALELGQGFAEDGVVLAFNQFGLCGGGEG